MLMRPLLDVQHLHSKGYSQLWLTRHSANYRTCTRSSADRQTAEMCLRFAALERKLGEIDRARSIYAHASQFCDPRVNPLFGRVETVSRSKQARKILSGRC